MHKIRILHITPSLEMGGAETFMYRLIDQDKNNHHTICLKDKGHYGKKLEEEGYTVFVLNEGSILIFLRYLKI